MAQPRLGRVLIGEGKAKHSPAPRTGRAVPGIWSQKPVMRNPCLRVLLLGKAREHVYAHWNAAEIYHWLDPDGVCA